MAYRQYCAVARSLDLIGDRWTLLIVRELLSGATRYAEIQRGLPGVPSNLLADRLRRLKHDGILTKDAAEYRLTARGEALRAVVHELVRWGGELMVVGRGDDAFVPRWLIVALDALIGPGPPLRVDIDVEGERIHVARDDRAAFIGAGPAAGADAVLTAPGEVVLALASGHLDLREAIARGMATCAGNVEAAHALFGEATIADADSRA